MGGEGVRVGWLFEDRRGEGRDFGVGGVIGLLEGGVEWMFKGV